jgi:Asp/Glu/hydantoin racemase
VGVVFLAGGVAGNRSEKGVAMRPIAYINPVGTGNYDEFMASAYSRYSVPPLNVCHLEDVPDEIDYFEPMHEVETGLLRLLPHLERSGTAAAIVGCCYDPAVRVAREVVDMPVIGPFEAALALSPYFAQSISVLTDSKKTASWLIGNVRLYGRADGVTVDWIDGLAVSDMPRSPQRVADAIAAKVPEILRRDRTEAVIVGCTTMAACWEVSLQAGWKPPSPIPVIDPNLTAIKVAAALAELQAESRYSPSREGFYARPERSGEVAAAGDR